MPRTNHVIDLPRTNHVIDLPRTNHVIDLPRTNHVIDLPRTNHVIDLPRTNHVIDLPRTNHVIDLPRKATVITNPITSLKSLWSYSTKRPKDSLKYSIRSLFIPNGDKLRGRPKTALLIVFNRDLSLIQHPLKLNLGKDLAETTGLAKDRKCWRGLTSQIEKTAKLSNTKNWDAKQQ